MSLLNRWVEYMVSAGVLRAVFLFALLLLFCILRKGLAAQPRLIWRGHDPPASGSQVLGLQMWGKVSECFKESFKLELCTTHRGFASGDIKSFSESY